MTRFDPMPLDQNRLIRDLERRIEALETLVKARPGMSEASAGWILRAMATPDTSALDAADGRIYFKGGRLTARNGGNGSEVQLLPIPGQGVPVADPPDFTSATTAGPTYDGATQNMLTNLRTDAAGNKIAMDFLLDSLRDAEIIAT